MPATPPSDARSATAFAPASVGNVGVGFDVLGHAFDAGIGDRVTVERTARAGEVEIASIRGLGAEALTHEAARNTVTAGLVGLLRERAADHGLRVHIEKGIPLGSGMGGSAASAVAGVVAASAVLDRPLTPEEMLRWSLVGEAVASGAAHGDNLAPGVWGGLVLVRAMEPVDALRIPVPDPLRCVLVHPHLRVDTKDARAVLPREVSMHLLVQQSANLAALVAGCFAGDLALIARALDDVVVEPHRARLIPRFAEVKQAAMEAGALGGSISGAGPSVFAWVDGDETAERVRHAMLAAFRAGGVEADGWISRVDAPGARIVDIA